MTTSREPVVVKLEDLRGRGPHVVCTTLPPVSAACRATQFGAARLSETGKGMFAWYEQHSDGCALHSGAGPVKSTESMEIFFAVRGRTMFQLDGQDGALAPGRYGLRNPGQGVKFTHPKKRHVVFHALEFSLLWWNKFLTEEAGWDRARADAFRFEGSVQPVPPALKAALMLVGQGFHEGVQSGSPLLVDTAAMQVAFLLLKDRVKVPLEVGTLRAVPPAPDDASDPLPLAAGRRRDPRLQQAIDFMEEHYAVPMGLEEIVEQAALCRSQFVRLFRREMKMAPYQYLMRYRVKQAVHLLKNQPAPSLESVSKAVGIPNLSHLTRLVRQATGKTPTQLRRASGPLGKKKGKKA